MSLMAGFDQILEVTPEFVADEVRLLVRLDGRTPMIAPFEYITPVLDADVNVTLGLLVTSGPEVEFAGAPGEPPGLRVTYGFEDSWMTGRVGTGGGVGSPIHGSLTLVGNVVRDNAPALGPPSTSSPTPAGSANSAAVFDFATTAVEVEFEGVALEDALSDTGFPPERFQSAAQRAIEADLRQRLIVGFPGIFGPTTRMPLSPTFVVFPPGATAVPDPLGLQALNLTFSTIAAQNGPPAALGVFVTLLPGPPGDVTTRTASESTAVADGNQVAVSLSAQAFLRTVFCPRLPGNLRLPTPPPPLPRVCGNAPAVSLPGAPAELTRIDVRFAAPDLLVVSGVVHSSGLCYEADGSFSVTVRLTATGGRISATRIGEPDVHVDLEISGWCWLLAALTLGSLSTWAALAVGLLGDGVAEDLLSGVLDVIPFGTFAPPGGLPFVMPTGVAASGEGITINATFNPLLPAPAERSLTLGRPELVRQETAEEESITSVGGPICVGDYATTIVRIRQRWRLDASADLIGRPLRWSVAGVDLEGTSGTTAIPGVRRLIDGSLVEGQVTIRYVIAGTLWGDSLELTNDDSDDGDYSVLVTVRGSESVRGSGPSASTLVSFEGTRYLRPDYKRCLDDFADHHRPMELPPPPPDSEDDPVTSSVAGLADRFSRLESPTPAELLHLLDPVIQRPEPHLVETLQVLSPAIGNSLFRALELAGQDDGA